MTEKFYRRTYKFYIDNKEVCKYSQNKLAEECIYPQTKINILPGHLHSLSKQVACSAVFSYEEVMNGILLYIDNKPYLYHYDSQEVTPSNFTVEITNVEYEMNDFEFRNYPDKIHSYWYMIEKEIENEGMKDLLRRMIDHNDNFIVLKENGSYKVVVGKDFSENLAIIRCFMNDKLNVTLNYMREHWDLTAEEVYDILIENNLLSRRVDFGR